jgi:hypothetical protein
MELMSFRRNGSAADKSENPSNGLNILLSRRNKNFLHEYEPYIVEKWRPYYFGYDVAKLKYKELKDSNESELLVQFERYFVLEIHRVSEFLESKLNQIQGFLVKLDNEARTSVPQAASASDLVSNTAYEASIRKAFEECQNCEDFYNLNSFAIKKIAKKYEKLVDFEVIVDFKMWPKFRSYQFFRNVFEPKISRVRLLRSDCVRLYSAVFRKTFPSLALGELKYAKAHTGNRKVLIMLVGLKLGCITTVVNLLAIVLAKAINVTS